MQKSIARVSMFTKNSSMSAEKKLERLYQLLREIEELEERIDEKESKSGEAVAERDYLETLKRQYNELHRSTFPR